MHCPRHWLALALCLLAGCLPSKPAQQLPAAESAGVRIQAEPWPEADKLFFNNPETPQWKGADVANSVALDEDRILWVFGDTLLAQPGTNRCERFDKFRIRVHNSLALQRGVDPATATIEHFWGHDAEGEPTSFFNPTGASDDWFWMGGVTELQGQVLVFLMHARPTVVNNEGPPTQSCAGLDFEMLGWSARMATVTTQTPDQWQWREVKLPQDVFWQQILVGSSTVGSDSNYLYAYSAGASTLAGNPIFLARWPLAKAVQADLSGPQWYFEGQWRSQAFIQPAKPTAIVKDGNNEISVSANPWPDEGNWWWLQSSQIVNSPLCYRNADTPITFGPCEIFYKPPELTRYPDSNLLVYAAKMHPVLSGAGNKTAIATYVVNSCDLEDIQEKCDLYYPRFLKLRLIPK